VNDEICGAAFALITSGVTLLVGFSVKF